MAGNTTEVWGSVKQAVIDVLREAVEHGDIIVEEPEVSFNVEQDVRDRTIYHFIFTAKNESGRRLLGRMMEDED